MTAYMPVIIWILGAGLSYAIMVGRGIRLTAVRNILAAVLGPFCIPLVLSLQPDRPAPKTGKGRRDQ